jgi:diguanylate cyclase (GGDEF)-like protein
MNRVLLIDDDLFFLQRNSDALTEKGCVTTLCRTAAEAEAALVQNEFETAVVDLILPDADGADLVRRLRREHAGVHVIVATQRDEARLAVQLIKEGVSEYLIKPFEASDLVEAVERVDEKRRQEGERVRLLIESIENYRLQTVYQRIIGMLTCLDMDKLDEMILQSISEILGAQGALLWTLVPGRKEFYRLEAFRGLVNLDEHPITWSLEDHPLAVSLLAGGIVEDAPLSNGEGAIVGEAFRDGSFLLPLAVEGALLGVVRVCEKLTGSYEAADCDIARVLGQFAAVSLRNCRAFSLASRAGLRERGSGAYNMAYFIDYAGKELYKAQRYGRMFSMVIISLDNLEFLRSQLNPDVSSQISRWLISSMGEVLRETDVLAQVNESEFYLITPDTDYIGALSCIRRSLDTFRGHQFIVDLDRHVPITLSMGAACYPAHGLDYDELLFACRERIEEQRRSPYRRLHLEDLDFHALADYLMGSEEDYSGIGPPKSAQSLRHTAIEDERGTNRHFTTDAKFFDHLQYEIAQEVRAMERVPLVCVLGPRRLSAALPLVDGLADFRSPHARVILVGAAPREEWRYEHLRAVTREDEFTRRHSFLFLLSEIAAYGVILRNTEEGRPYGFHTSDDFLVENLISKFEAAYGLQGTSADERDRR